MKQVKIDHPNINFMTIGDIHQTVTPPGRRNAKYSRAILGKLQQISDKLTGLNGIALCVGDVYHSKSPTSSRNSHWLNATMIASFHKFPGKKVYGVIGNHDIQYDRLETLEQQPINVLISAGCYENIGEESVLFSNDDLSVEVVGFNYTPQAEELLQEILNYPPRQGTYRIAVVHALGAPGESSSMFGNEYIIGYNQLKNADFDFVIWGHDHSRKETVTVGNVTHVNLGSLSRSSLSSDEVDRIVSSFIISCTPSGVKVREFSIEVEPLNTAFRTADKRVETIRTSTGVVEFFSDMESQVEEMEFVTKDPRAVLEDLAPKDNKEVLEAVLDLCGF